MENHFSAALLGVAALLLSVPVLEAQVCVNTLLYNFFLLFNYFTKASKFDK